MNTAYLIAGLAFGDEGKGATVDFLCRRRQADLVVRYNGGAQAAHNVVTPDGRHHTFSQFGSGTFIPGVRTHLSRFVLVNPLNMMREEEHLREVGVLDAWQRLTVEDKALIITPYHKAVNRILEAWRGDHRHGSCGQGIGITRQLHLEHGDSVLFAGDLRYPALALKKLQFIRDICYQTVENLGPSSGTHEDYRALVMQADFLQKKYFPWTERVKIVKSSYLADALQIHPVTVFEGAQGVLLDEVHGQAPYNTWTDCTFNNAATLLKESNFDGDAVKVGVLRTYFTRHGAGPFPTECNDQVTRKNKPEPHNSTGLYQGNFRIGTFDFDLAKKALEIVRGVDFIALNHSDRSGINAADIRDRLGVRVGISSIGPTADDRTWLAT